ncbi:MAG: hypothetical protein JW808_04935 [Victivallales bacterium]|nr:hypothetical protein [Victivallales bacterium]
MASKEETNLKKLMKSSILMNFIKKNDGRWNHEQWLGLLDDLAMKGYKPIDANQVGLLLEEKKEIYLAKK